MGSFEAFFRKERFSLSLQNENSAVFLVLALSRVCCSGKRTTVYLLDYKMICSGPSRLQCDLPQRWLL